MNVVLKMLDLLCKLKNQIPSLKVSTVLQSHTCVLLALTWYISLLYFLLITQPSRRRQPSLGFDVVVVVGGGGGGFLGFFFFLWFAELAILRLRSTGLTRHCFVPRKMADTCLVCFRYIRDIKPWNHLHMYTVVIL